MRKVKETYNLSGNTINKYTGDGWRLIHDGTNVIHDIFYAENATTQTIRNLEAFDTSGETLTEIIVLGLNYDPTSVVENEVDNYLGDL